MKLKTSNKLTIKKERENSTTDYTGMKRIIRGNNKEMK